MQGWHYGKRLISYRPIFRLPQGQSYTERQYLLTTPKNLNLKFTQVVNN